jgi:hypothetical protein
MAFNIYKNLLESLSQKIRDNNARLSVVNTVYAEIRGIV